MMVVVMVKWVASNLVPRVFVPLDQGLEKQELWEQPFQACSIDADRAVKPDGQNSFNLKWLLPELSFSDHWSWGTKTLGTRLG